MVVIEIVMGLKMGQRPIQAKPGGCTPKLAQDNFIDIKSIKLKTPVTCFAGGDVM